LANFAHLDNQSDSEKKAKRHSKALGEKRPNPGSFWFTAVGGSFFPATQELQSGQFGLGMAKMAHIKPILCVFAKPFYFPVDIQRLKCILSKQTSSKQHVLALGLCG
jgi:hypothetical protein